MPKNNKKQRVLKGDNNVYLDLVDSKVQLVHIIHQIGFSRIFLFIFSVIFATIAILIFQVYNPFIQWKIVQWKINIFSLSPCAKIGDSKENVLKNCGKNYIYFNEERTAQINSTTISYGMNGTNYTYKFYGNELYSITIYSKEFNKVHKRYISLWFGEKSYYDENNLTVWFDYRDDDLLDSIRIENQKPVKKTFKVTNKVKREYIPKGKMVSFLSTNDVLKLKKLAIEDDLPNYNCGKLGSTISSVLQQCPDYKSYVEENSTFSHHEIQYVYDDSSVTLSFYYGKLSSIYISEIYHELQLDDLERVLGQPVEVEIHYTVKKYTFSVGDNTLKIDFGEQFLGLTLEN